MAALEQALAKLIHRLVCRGLGHVPQTLAWGIASRANQPCRRCGLHVAPVIDWTGHP